MPHSVTPEIIPSKEDPFYPGEINLFVFNGSTFRFHGQDLLSGMPADFSYSADFCGTFQVLPRSQHHHIGIPPDGRGKRGKIKSQSVMTNVDRSIFRFGHGRSKILDNILFTVPSHRSATGFIESAVFSRGQGELVSEFPDKREFPEFFLVGAVMNPVYKQPCGPFSLICL
jgi:hypothetical protein